MEGFTFIDAGGHIDIYYGQDESNEGFEKCFYFALKGKYYFYGWDKKSIKLANKLNKILLKLNKLFVNAKKVNKINY